MVILRIDILVEELEKKNFIYIYLNWIKICAKIQNSLALNVGNENQQTTVVKN